MSIAAANLYISNIHREFINKNPTDKQEAQMAKWVSLIVKFVQCAGRQAARSDGRRRLLRLSRALPKLPCSWQIACGLRSRAPKCRGREAYGLG
jgi:hypothetical protein